VPVPCLVVRERLDSVQRKPVRCHCVLLSFCRATRAATTRLFYQTFTEKSRGVFLTLCAS
jgi:hypothetical protein